MRAIELKNEIIDDLRLCICHEVNKENDLLCMMEQYIKTERKRTALLPQIKNLLDGKEYTNPFDSYYPYKERDIIELEEILEMYIQAQSHNYLIESIERINEIHERCNCEFIDEWRTIRLKEFFICMEESDNYDEIAVAIEFSKRW